MNRKNIAFLGLGAMGQRMAQRLIDAGHHVTVWNRTPGKVSLDGAAWADTPALAARDAELVFSMVRDDAASHTVWLGPDGALAALPEGAVGIECSTLSLPHVDTLAAAFQKAGRDLLDAPVAGSRPQAEAGALIFLVGGNSDTLNRATPALEVLGSKIHHAGPTGAGALVKLMVNALFGTQLATIAELLGFAARAGHDVERVADILLATPVTSPAAAAATAAMLEGLFAAVFPIELVAKDFGLVASSALAHGADVPLADATGAVYAAATKEGYGNDNITGIVQRYR